jgi:hypothetical protein
MRNADTALDTAPKFDRAGVFLWLALELRFRVSARAPGIGAPISTVIDLDELQSADAHITVWRKTDYLVSQPKLLLMLGSSIKNVLLGFTTRRVRRFLD